MYRSGWQYAIPRREWTDLLDEYRTAAKSVPTLAPLLSIIESVIENQMQDRLAATTSMWDLVITTAPAGEPPLDVIVVRSSVSMSPSPAGEVRIEQFATSGQKEEVTRPVAEALPLFWRFVLAKFGLKPA